MMQYAVYNPRGVSVEELPAIYGFNNGGSPGFYHAVLVAEDGECLGSHLCSSEHYVPGDLGLLDGHRPDRHETFREHYPGGYRMVYVPHDRVHTHAGLDAACRRNAERAEAEDERVEDTP